jgi:anti-sigma regulatory factor (Ser/Thr protein kinase)
MTDDLLISMLASTASAGLARTLAEQRLHKWDYFHISGDALLIVAELVANAAQETSKQEIKFALRRDAGGVLIAVWDSSPRPPEPAPVIELTLDTLDLSEENFDANGGRGLRIVEALATDCGYRPDPIDPATGHSPGKWVWARLKA